MRNAIALATVAAAKDLSIAAIVCYTQTGATAELLSELRPTAPILALTPNAETARRLSLHWGVFPLEVPALTSTKAMIRTAEQMAEGYARPGDIIAISLGISDGGDSNALILHRIPE
jgi:pyruvate kinase